MSKTKKTTTTRTEVDAAIADWKTKLEARNAATERLRAITEARQGLKAPTPHTLTGDSGRLRALEAEIEMLKAVDDAAFAEAHAAALLDAFEVEKGDSLAMGASVTVFRDDLAALQDDEARLVRELADKRRELVARRSAGQATHEQLCARRDRNGEPRPAVVVSFSTATIDGLDEKIARLGQPAKDNSERIAAVRRDEIELRAALERSAREARERDAASTLRGAEIAAEQRAVVANNQARNGEVVAQHEAARAEDEALAEAHRSRVA